MRTLRLTAIVAVLTGLLGCGSGDVNAQSVIDRLPQLLIGTWLRDQESSDGGQTWVDRTDDLRFTFLDGSHWADNRNRAGTYSLYRDKLVYIWPGNETRFVQLRVLSNGNRLEWVFYTSDSYTTTTDYVSRWTRISAR